MIIIKDFPDPIIQCDNKNVYYPSDDTYLIIDYFKRNVNEDSFDGIETSKIKQILDLGTGTGIISIFLQLLTKKYSKFNAKIYALDILEEAIKCGKENAKINKVDPEIEFIKSDLFNSLSDNLKYTFNIIIFNPPYLPSITENTNKTRNDNSWDGGNKGYEIILKFLEGAKDFLDKNNPSYVYFISSSKTELNELKLEIEERGFNIETINKKHIFFEDIILNRLTPSH